VTCATSENQSKKGDGVKYSKLIGAIVLIVSSCSFAGIDLRVGGGLNLSNEILTGDYKLPEWQYKPMHAGFNAGLNVRIYAFGKFGIGAGLSYETRGSGMKTDEAKVPMDAIITAPMEFSMNYLQIPVYFYYRLLPGLSVGLGPELGIFLNGKQEVAGQSSDIDKIKTIDLGASITADYTLLNMITVGAGYYFGFLNNDGRTSADVMQGSDRNTNIKIYIAYVLKLL
jgi:hypothetical protein